MIRVHEYDKFMGAFSAHMCRSTSLCDLQGPVDVMQVRVSSAARLKPNDDPKN